MRYDYENDENNNNETVMVIGIDHGYGNMKTATNAFHPV